MACNADAADQFDQVLLAFGEEVELEGLSFDEDYCCFGTENGRVIHLQRDDDRLLLFTEIGDLPVGAGRQEILEDLLGANAFLVGSKGAVLSIERTSGKVLMQRHEPIAVLAKSGLTDPLTEFIEAADHWSGRLGPSDQTGERAPPPQGVDLA